MLGATRAQYLTDYACRLRAIADKVPLPMHRFADHADPCAGPTAPSDDRR